MLVRRARPHILSELRLELFIYRILLLVPFEIQSDHHLASTWRIRLYMCSMLLVYVTLRVSYCLQFERNDETFQYFLSNGKVWMLVYMFNFVFSTLSFGCIILNGLFTSTHQIKFFQEFHNFDAILFADFGISIIRSRTRKVNSLALFLGFAYFIGYFLSSWAHPNTSIMNSFQLFSYFITEYFDNILNLLSALYYINCTQLCRERLVAVNKLLQNYCNFSNEQMDIVLQLYVRICIQISLINRFMGIVVLIKITHDFTLGSTIVYAICSSLYSAEIFKELFDLILWLGQTIIGTLLITLIANMLITEV